MIPADVVSRLQVSADAALRPVAPTQEVADKLSGLAVGQRVMAEIQAMLPNGTYRAVINQRDITLALPFSAKAGDTLELLVTESDGQLALAVSERDAKGAAANPPSVATTLSRTGQLIGNLLGGGAAQPDELPATPLNGGRPIAAAPPGTGQDLAPLLKQAITQSGLFYEAHQAAWAEGRLDKAALLQEPQGRLAPLDASKAAERTAPSALPTAPPATVEANTARPAGDSGLPATVDSARASGQTPASLVAAQAQPLVQQQLESLATQQFAWQGQVWPGQSMRWEIEEDGRRDAGEEETATRWSTRLRLTLPHLGEIDARIRLEGNQVMLGLQAAEAPTRELMTQGSAALRGQLDAAGLSLVGLGIDDGTGSDPDGQRQA